MANSRIGHYSHKSWKDSDYEIGRPLEITKDVYDTILTHQRLMKQEYDKVDGDIDQNAGAFIVGGKVGKPISLISPQIVRRSGCGLCEAISNDDITNALIKFSKRDCVVRGFVRIPSLGWEDEIDPYYGWKESSDNGEAIYQLGRLGIPILTFLPRRNKLWESWKEVLECTAIQNEDGDIIDTNDCRCPDCEEGDSGIYTVGAINVVNNVRKKGVKGGKSKTGKR